MRVDRMFSCLQSTCSFFFVIAGLFLSLQSASLSAQLHDKSGQIGVNFSRYFTRATKGCWVEVPNGDGYWSNDYCKITSAKKAGIALKQAGFRKLKLFAPGKIPAQDLFWQYTMWKEDLQALSQLDQDLDLFIGIPNSFLFDIAGVSLNFSCSGGRFDSPEVAKSQGCSNQEIVEQIRKSCLEADVLDLTSVESWMHEFVQPFLGSNIKIEWIGVGNEPFASWHEGLYDDVVLIALKKVQSYLDLNMPGVKGSVPFAGTFAEKAAKVEPVLDFLELNQSVFMQNVYPHTDAFTSLINHVLDNQKNKVDLKKGDLANVLIDQSHLRFMKDFLNWALGEATNRTFPTASFYESYLNGYRQALKGAWGDWLPLMKHWNYSLPLLVGETGWPSYNDRVYNRAFIDVKFDSLIIDEGQLVTLPISALKQIVSNELFNASSAQKYTQNLVNFYKKSSERAYLFELLDEANKGNESQSDHELESHWGLFTHYADDGRYSQHSPLLPKFPLML